jgi:Glycosyl hydrolase family 92 catalytic domain
MRVGEGVGVCPQVVLTIRALHVYFSTWVHIMCVSVLCMDGLAVSVGTCHRIFPRSSPRWVARPSSPNTWTPSLKSRQPFTWRICCPIRGSGLATSLISRHPISISTPTKRRRPPRYAEKKSVLCGVFVLRITMCGCACFRLRTLWVRTFSQSICVFVTQHTCAHMHTPRSETNTTNELPHTHTHTHTYTHTHTHIQWVRHTQKEYYTLLASGLPGNDDYGTLSAWFVWSSLGVFPLHCGDQYVLGAPLFDEITIQLSSTATLTV